MSQNLLPGGGFHDLSAALHALAEQAREVTRYIETLEAGYADVLGRLRLLADGSAAPAPGNAPAGKRGPGRPRKMSASESVPPALDMAQGAAANEAGPGGERSAVSRIVQKVLVPRARQAVTLANTVTSGTEQQVHEDHTMTKPFGDQRPAGNEIPDPATSGSVSDLPVTQEIPPEDSSTTPPRSRQLLFDDGPFEGNEGV